MTSTIQRDNMLRFKVMA